MRIAQTRDVEVGAALIVYYHARAPVHAPCASSWVRSPTLNELLWGTGMEESLQMIKGIINEQIDSGIPVENIILAGYSQVWTAF